MTIGQWVLYGATGAGVLTVLYSSCLTRWVMNQSAGDENLAEELVAKGLERVKQYSWRQMAEDTLAVYQSVLN